jgi:hypothetical protein
MREALTSRRVWDVRIEIAAMAADLKRVRIECEKILKDLKTQEWSKLFKDMNQFQVRLRREGGAPQYIANTVLNRIGAGLRTANGDKQSFDLLQVLHGADANWEKILNEFRGEAPLNEVLPILPIKD